MAAPASTEIGWLIVRAIENCNSPAEVGENYGKAQRSTDLKPMGGNRRSKKIEINRLFMVYGFRHPPVMSFE